MHPRGGTGFLCLLVLILFTASLAHAQANLSTETLAWDISKPLITVPGSPVTDSQGTRVTGFQLQAIATARQGSKATTGTLVFDLSAVSPAVATTQRKVGRWYLEGTWTFTAQGATAEQLKARHNAHQMRGAVSADLAVNPLAGVDFSARASVPMSFALGRWGRGDGILTFKKGFNGELQISLTRWPAPAAKSIATKGLTLAMRAAGTNNVRLAGLSEMIPDRVGPAGTTVPNPGTQQQELGNITAPAPYNVFEFVVTCMACHGGAVDQQVGHGGNWAGTSMGNSARDPVFRANQIGVQNTVKSLGLDGAGNICMRCHSPNGWYSGRFDPLLGGKGDGSNMMQSPLLSTDAEGIACEVCHRATGNVITKKYRPNEAVWNMMAGIADWPHAGLPYPAGPQAGLPFGDTSLQINDGMTYAGRFSGSVKVTVGDDPDALAAQIPGAGGLYTGQTYGTYPSFPIIENGQVVNKAGQVYVRPDGAISIHAEWPIAPPFFPSTTIPDYQKQAYSPEHPTHDSNGFVSSPEFCGTCHDLTVPVVNHGMPEQRTYTEWRYGKYGRNADGSKKPEFQQCQMCHMPRLKHEFADDDLGTTNVDLAFAPWGAAGAKNRAIHDDPKEQGTPTHKFAGSNRDLGQMMKVLYPEVDLEVTGAPTGNDPTIFPGMLSDRSTMWDRGTRNTELHMRDAATVEVIPGTLREASPGVYEVQVKITNESGHRLPTGYPDGRRVWLEVQVFSGQTSLYRSGYYDAATATLSTAQGTPFRRAVTNVIDASSGGSGNAVMVYEKVTGSCDGGMTSCSESPNLLNATILFDNRIPPAEFQYDLAKDVGGKYVAYSNEATKVPAETPARYTSNGGLHNNWDIVTYRFNAPAGQGNLRATAAAYWQTHSREFMEHLRTQDNSTVRPEGPPSIFAANYPNTPNYIGDNIAVTQLTSISGAPLKDNWGGVAYAAWMMTGKGAPFLVARADTSVTTPPAAATAAIAPADIQSFSIRMSWAQVPSAEGYYVWTRYGQNDLTASWDRLAVLHGAGSTSFLNEALNPFKTYCYRVQPFNAAGVTAVAFNQLPTTCAKTLGGDPLPPENLTVLSINKTTQPYSATLQWFDGSTNETTWVIQRWPVGEPGVATPTVIEVPSGNSSGGGSITWTDTTVELNKTYNYEVAARNNAGTSAFTAPVQVSLEAIPAAPTNVVPATAPSNTVIQLTWGASAGAREYVIQRKLTTAVAWTEVGVVIHPTNTFTNTGLLSGTGYNYRVAARNFAGTSAFTASNPATISTSGTVLPAPTTLTLLGATGVPTPQVRLRFVDNATNETGFRIERAQVTGGVATFTLLATIGPRAGTGAVNYTDSGAGVIPGAIYSYRVYAYQSGTPQINSAYSNTITLMVPPGTAPAAPAILQVTSGTSTIKVDWLDNSENEFQFEVGWKLTSSVNWTGVVNLGANTTSYTITGLTPGTSYQVRVRAKNPSGNSAYAGPVQISTK